MERGEWGALSFVTAVLSPGRFSLVSARDLQARTLLCNREMVIFHNVIVTESTKKASCMHLLAYL